MTMTLTQTMNANANPEFGRLMAATRAEQAENRANKEFLTKAADRLGHVSPNIPMTLQH